MVELDGLCQLWYKSKLLALKRDRQRMNDDAIEIHRGARPAIHGARFVRFSELFVPRNRVSEDCLDLVAGIGFEPMTFRL